MRWKDYYRDFYKMPHNERVTAISYIDDFRLADTEQIVEAALSFGNRVYATRLIKRAMECRVSFSAAQAAELIGGVSEDFRRNLALSAYGRYTEQQLEEMRNHLSEDDIKSLGKPIGAKRQKQKSDSGIGFWGHLFAITAAICKASRRKR